MNIVIPKPVNEILNLLYENNYEGYIVGGTIRDMVMGEKPRKYEICTNGPLDKIQKILKDYETRLVGENNSKLYVVNNKFPMEIAIYRTPSKTLESELEERDFTMNALAYSDEDGLIDYTTGILDIRDKVIRINGEDDRLFVEDPLRILRAIRLSAEYGMRIDRETQEYMFDDKDMLQDVANERIRDEFSKILVAYRSEFYIKKYFEIFLSFIPELALMENFNQHNEHHIYDVLNHSLVAMKNIEPDLDLRLAILFHDIGKPFTFTRDPNGIGHFKGHAKKSADMTREILNRLKFNKKTIQRVTKLIEFHDSKIPEEEVELKRFLDKFGTSDIEALYKLQKANLYGKNPAFVSDLSKLDLDFQRLKQATRKTYFVKRNDLKITGKEIIDLGLEQENVGTVIDIIYNTVMEGKLKNNHDKIVDYIVTKIKGTI